MGIGEVLLVAVSLSMDAFAVAVCKGLAMKSVTLRRAAAVGLWFGVFQALMPMLGFLLGDACIGYIEAYDHWIAFGLLLLIGANMIIDALRGEADAADADVSPKKMIGPALATSIDALAVGVAFSAVGEGGLSIWVCAPLIGAVTFALSCAGVLLGGVFGKRFLKSAKLIGGVVLIGIGGKILLEHLGIFG